jgi:hypothetical protein
MSVNTTWFNKNASEKEQKAQEAATAAKYPPPKEYAAGTMEALSSVRLSPKKAPRKKKK